MIKLLLQIVEEFYQKHGYNKIDILPREFTWKPDILLRKREDYIACLIRINESIPELLIQRIASMKIKNNLNILIIFSKKPKISTIKNISLYGIGIATIKRKELIIISKSKNFSKNREKQKQRIIHKAKKMSRIDIFVSSHQIIPERKCVKDVIDEIRTFSKTPIFPVLVEEDSRYTFSKTKKCIDKNMNDTEMFIGILAEDFREKVNYEIRRSFLCYDLKNILIFIKECKKCQDSIKLIDWIEKQNSVKYLEYTNLKDLEMKAKRSLLIKLKNLHDKKNIPFLE